MKYVNKDISLIINGKPNDSLSNIIKTMDLCKKVRFIGYVEEDLSIMYNLCKLFVYPSLYEGFGLPPLEALACGSKVLVADTSALREIFDDESIRFNPLDSLELSKKMII